MIPFITLISWWVRLKYNVLEYYKENILHILNKNFIVTEGVNIFRSK